MPKKSIRAFLLEKRKALSPALWQAKSIAIQETLLQCGEYSQSRTIALYSPVHNEVDTSLVFREAIFSGKTVIFPAVSGTDLIFRQVNAPSELAKGKFGVLEPAANCAPVSPADAELIIVPGIAFDLVGNRIGYGKGFYDRALHKLEQTGRLIALCYDFQLLDKIVGEPHDVMMDRVITERRNIVTRDSTYIEGRLS